MCTIAWARDEEGTTILFTRDEKRARPAALPPVTDSDGIVYPVDPQGGGTWIYLHPAGHCAALLNHYNDGTPLPSPRSRGQLLLALRNALDPASFYRLLAENLREHPTQPCSLVWIDQTEAHAWLWNGETLDRIPLHWPMLTTSSVRGPEIVARRQKHYANLCADPLSPRTREIQAFHEWKDTLDPAIGVYMSRPDARSVSRTMVTLHPEQNRLQYNPL